MECLPPDHLHDDGGSWRIARSSVQQLERQPIKVQNEVSS